jgi:hypothetical protein
LRIRTGIAAQLAKICYDIRVTDFVSNISPITVGLSWFVKQCRLQDHGTLLAAELTTGFSRQASKQIHEYFQYKNIMAEPYAATTTDAASAAAATAAASTLSETAFRQAEKRYQLHYDQQMRLR